MDWSQSQIKLFRTLLYCYPAEFRNEYGTEMEQLFADRLALEPPPRLWAETLADLTISATREHLYALLADAKHGLRVFAAQPAFTAIAVLVMAVGIAASVSVFSLSNAILFRSLPYADPSRLVYLWSPNRNFKGVPDEMGPNLADFVDWQRHSRSFASMATFQSEEVNLVRQGSSTRFGAAEVSGDFFKTLGVSAQLGRTLDRSDDQPGHNHVIAISDALWRSRFGSSPDVLGKTVQLDRQQYTVVGVMPADFGFPFDGDVPYEHAGLQTDIWVAAGYTAAQKADRTNLEVSPNALARLRPGVTASQAEAELAGFQAAVQNLYPPMWRGFTALVRPLVETIIGPVRQMFWILLGAAGLVMLIAIANTANLLLARTASRAHELGIRTALGAERSRIIRQLLTESVMLSAAAGALGVALSYAVVRLLLKLNPGGIPRFQSAGVDGRVLFFAVVLSLFAGVAAGIAPALFAARVNVNGVLKNGVRTVATGFLRGRFALIAVEIALSVILLASSGLLLRSYLNLAATNPGFSPSTLTFSIPLDDRYNTPQKRSLFYRQALESFKHIPGVRYAGESNGLPLTGYHSVGFVYLSGRGRIPNMIENRQVTPDFLRAMGLPLLRGRDISSQEVVSHRNVAIVNQQFAAAFLPGSDPLGAHFRIGIGGDLSREPEWTVIGMVGNTAGESLEENRQPQFFIPADAGDQFALACTVPVEKITNSVRAVLHSLDPVLTLDDVRTMRDRMTASNARRTFQTTLLTGFSSVALALALIGLYGLMSYLVRQRTAEIGIRLALGSPKLKVIRLILAQGLRLTFAGVLIGNIAAFGLTHLLKSWLFRVNAIDGPTFAGVTLAVLLVTCCGILVPAWSATRIDPIEALRRE